MPTNARLYDQLDLLYRELWSDSLHHGLWDHQTTSAQQARETLAQKCLSALDPQPDEQIADIGCGYGSFSHRIAESAPCQIEAFSTSSKQIDKARQHPSVRYHCGDWLQHQLPENSLSKAIALESLSHFFDWQGFLSASSKPLKKRSVFVISDWFADPYPSKTESYLLNFLAHSAALPKWRPLGSFLSLAQNNVFKLQSYEDLSLSAAPTWTSLFKRACAAPIKNPRLLPSLARNSMRRPSLVASLPLLRFAYHTRLLRYVFLVLVRR